MHEQVLRTLGGLDEAVALRIVEPLHGSFCHMKYTSHHYSRTHWEGALCADRTRSNWCHGSSNTPPGAGHPARTTELEAKRASCVAATAAQRSSSVATAAHPAATVALAVGNRAAGSWEEIRPAPSRTRRRCAEVTRPAALGSSAARRPGSKPAPRGSCQPAV